MIWSAMDKKTVDVIIPTYRPDERFERLIGRLKQQTHRPAAIRIINTDASAWDLSPALAAEFERGRTDCGIALFVCHISKEEFDHGGTRNRAAAASPADVLLFMTQDAVPADTHLIGNLLEFLGQEKDGAQVAAAYARQLPGEDCGFIERYTRGFNYGGAGMVKSAEDLPRLGIKTYFCSNVCAAYLHEIYDRMGGFEAPAIFNEDMIFAARLINSGYRIAYAAEARVVHSHNYSGVQQFRRNFDLAVSQADHPEIFADVRSENEGMRLVKDTARYLIRSGRGLYLFPLVWQSACKYAGYCLGKRYRRLPMGLVKKCSMNKDYWK